MATESEMADTEGSTATAASWMVRERSFEINQRAWASSKLIENKSSVVEAR